MIQSLRSGIALCGEYRPAGDKSLSHRAALFAALATGQSRIDHFLLSGVTEAMLTVLRELGVVWSLDEAGVLTVDGVGLRGFQAPTSLLNCGNSATTFRLVAGALAGAGTPCVLSGSTGLQRRPMGRIIDPLRQMGTQIDAEDNRAPLTFGQGDGLRAINYALPVASAQVKSALILAALSANAPTLLSEPGPSRDHTERMLRSMGAKIDSLADNHLVIHPQLTPLHPLTTTLAGDISSGAFLMVAAAITRGSRVTLCGVGVNPTRTGIVDALTQMGAQITYSNPGILAGEPIADLTIESSTLHGITLQGDIIVRMIDEFPILMIAAACATGETIIRDAQELRHKESDRLAVMCSHLRTIGVAVEEYPDGCKIVGGTIAGGVTVDAHGDHRIAMSLLIAGLVSQAPISVDHAEMINESFPDFLGLFEKGGLACDRI